MFSEVFARFLVADLFYSWIGYGHVWRPDSVAIFHLFFRVLEHPITKISPFLWDILYSLKWNKKNSEEFPSTNSKKTIKQGPKSTVCPVENVPLLGHTVNQVIGTFVPSRNERAKPCGT